MPSTPNLIAVIADLETVTGFLLAGIGSMQKESSNYVIVEEDTPLDNGFRASVDSLVSRPDIAVVFVVKHLEQMLKEKVQQKNSIFPIVVAIPETTN